VEYESADDAAEAIRTLHDSDLQGEYNAEMSFIWSLGLHFVCWTDQLCLSLPGISGRAIFVREDQEPTDREDERPPRREERVPRSRGREERGGGRAEERRGRGDRGGRKERGGREKKEVCISPVNCQPFL
jgi:hypothetical protein